MSDLTERIRNGIIDGWSADYPCLDGEIASEAADALEAQEARIAELESVLKPFYDLGYVILSEAPPSSFHAQLFTDSSGNVHMISLEQFRNAIKALTPPLK